MSRKPLEALWAEGHGESIMGRRPLESSWVEGHCRFHGKKAARGVVGRRALQISWGEGCSRRRGWKVYSCECRSRARRSALAPAAALSICAASDVLVAASAECREGRSSSRLGNSTCLGEGEGGGEGEGEGRSSSRLAGRVRVEGWALGSRRWAVDVAHQRPLDPRGACKGARAERSVGVRPCGHAARAPHREG